MYFYLFACRIKATLKSGELQVPKDQWPIFIYFHCEYDPEDLWKGTFQDALLILLCYIFISHWLSWHHSMHIDMYSHCQALSIRSQRQQGLEMPGVMAWPVSHCHLLTTLPLRYVINWSPLPSNMNVSLYLLCIKIFSHVLLHGHNHQLWTHLWQQHQEGFWRSWRTSWSQKSSHMVELVSSFIHLWDGICSNIVLCSQIFPQYSSAKPPPPKNSTLTKIKEHQARKRAVFTTAHTNGAVNPHADNSWFRIVCPNFIWFVVAFSPLLEWFSFCAKCT